MFASGFGFFTSAVRFQRSRIWAASQSFKSSLAMKPNHRSQAVRGNCMAPNRRIRRRCRSFAIGWSCCLPPEFWAFPCAWACQAHSDPWVHAIPWFVSSSLRRVKASEAFGWVASCPAVWRCSSTRCSTAVATSKRSRVRRGCGCSWTVRARTTPGVPKLRSKGELGV